MKNVLVINLTRFGDLVQSQALITDLVRQGHRAGVLCQENFSQAAALLKGADAVFPLAGARILARLDGPWQDALAHVLGLWHDIDKAFAPDVVDNISPTISAQILGRFMAGSRPAWGFCLDEHGFDRNTSPWAAFLEGASAARGGSPFNIIDCFRQAGRDPDGPVAAASRALAAATADGTAPADGASGAGPLFRPGDSLLNAPDRDAVAEALALLESEASALPENEPPARQGREPSDGKGRFIAFQLGASDERRQWPVDSFAVLGQRLWEEAGLRPVLLGSRSEMPLAEAYAQKAGHPFINLTGRTDLARLAATLRCMRLLVTNDTGTMHLAAGLGLPVLAVFLATAQPFDTGPSLAGSCSLEPDMDCHPCSFGAACPREHACRRAVTPQAVAALCLGWLGSGQWTAGPGMGCRAWLTGHDQQGYIRLTSLSGHENQDRSLWLAELGRVLCHFIDRDRNKAFVYPAAPGILRFSPVGEKSLLAELRQLTGLLTLLTAQGQALTQTALPAMRQKFMDTWNGIRRCLSDSPWLGSLAGLWLEETQNRDRDFAAVLSVAAQYQALFEGLAARLGQQNENGPLLA